MVVLLIPLLGVLVGYAIARPGEVESVIMLMTKIMMAIIP